MLPAGARVPSRVLSAESGQHRWRKLLFIAYSREDGIVDWRYCRTGNPKVDVEVGGTHLGLIFNSTTHMHIADRLACARGKGSLAEALVQFSGRRRRFSSHFSTLG